MLRLIYTLFVIVLVSVRLGIMHIRLKSMTSTPGESFLFVHITGKHAFCIPEQVK